VIREEEYATLVGPHERDGRQVWALCCPHTSVSTDLMETLFSPNDAIGLFVLIATTYPHAFSADEIATIVLRELLGAVLQLNCSGGCGRRPYALLTSQDGSVRVLDVDDLP
jgi:hypothetical protein